MLGNKSVCLASFKVLKFFRSYLDMPQSDVLRRSFLRPRPDLRRVEALQNPQDARFFNTSENCLAALDDSVLVQAQVLRIG